MATPTSTPSDRGDDEHQVPRWVKGFVLAAIVVGLLVVVGLVAGSGGHGPSRHLPGGEPTTQATDGDTSRVDDG